MPDSDARPSRDVVAFLKDRDKPCPRCEYNLRGVGAPVCPECGWKLVFSRMSATSGARSQGFWQIGFVGGLISAGLLTCFLLEVVSDRPGLEPLAWALLLMQIAALFAWWCGAKWLRARGRRSRWLLALAISWPLALFSAFIAFIILQLTLLILLGP